MKRITLPQVKERHKRLLVLIKENHIRACGSITEAVRRCRENGETEKAKIEVETATLTEVQEALNAGVDRIMLDNMSIPGKTLGSWSHHRSAMASKQAHTSIRNALSNYSGWAQDIVYDIFLQGSYKNSTNLQRDSDVDLVVRFALYRLSFILRSRCIFFCSFVIKVGRIIMTGFI